MLPTDPPRMEYDRPAIRQNLPRNCSTEMSRTCWGWRPADSKSPNHHEPKGCRKMCQQRNKRCCRRAAGFERGRFDHAGREYPRICQTSGMSISGKRKSEISGHPPHGVMQPENFELRGRRWVKTLVEASIHSGQVFECGLAACDPWM